MLAQDIISPPRVHRRLSVKVGGHGRVKIFTYDGTMEGLLSSALAFGIVPGQVFRPDIDGKFKSHHIVDQEGRLIVEPVPDRRAILGKLYSHFTAVRKAGASMDEAIKIAIDDPDNQILWGHLDTYLSKRSYLISISQPRIPWTKKVAVDAGSK